MANAGRPRPSFSVIIPTYNRAPFIERTIRSVLDQRCEDFELIVVDDGSTDGTKELVEGIDDPRVSYFWKENGERGAARNYGAERARGAYVTFLDSDDYLYVDYLSNARESLDEGSQPAFLHLAYESVDTEGNRIHAYDDLDPDDYKLLVYGNPFSCLGWFVRRDTFEEIRFNEDRRIAGSEDWEFLMRLVARHGFAVDRRISAALLRHNESSVLNVSEASLHERKMRAVDYAMQDESVQKRFATLEGTIRGYALSYVSLHLVVAGMKTPGCKYYLRALRQHPPLLFSKRSLVIIKKLLLG